MVDVANVMGARADGWWHDPAGAALRLCREVIALAGRGDDTAGAWVLVLEGRARAAVARLESETALVEDTAPPGEWVPPVDESPTVDETAPVRLVSAPGSGDDAIVGAVAEAVGEDESCLVVTADRELRRRCEELNASVVGPGWLLRLLLPGNIEVNRPSAPQPYIARCGSAIDFSIDRNLMRMYLTLVLAALLILGLSGLTAYLTTARRKARKQQAVAARLEAVAARAAREHNDREAAAKVSSALTTVLPAIQNDDLGQSGVRRVA